MKKLVLCITLMTILFSAAASAAVPPVSTKCLIQYKADALNLADGASVSSWGASYSGALSSGNYTLATVTNYGVPTFVASGYNGYPVVRFVRQTDPTGEPNTEKTVLQSANWTWTTGTAAKGITVFSVAQGGKSFVNQRMLRVGLPAGTNRKIFDCDMRSGFTDNTVGTGARYSNGYSVAPNAQNEDEWHIIVRKLPYNAQYNTLFVSVDGVSKTVYGSNPTTSTTYTPQDASNCVIMGNGTNNTGGWLNEWYDGDVAEVLVYTAELTTDEIATVYDYLNKKYTNMVAHTPSPAKFAVDQGEVYVDGGAPWRTDVTLSWDKGHDPRITKHYLYYAETPEDPNLTSMVWPKQVLSATGDSASTTVRIESGTRHYWRVDEVWDGAEPNQITGEVWYFTPTSAKPRVTVNPSDVAYLPGDTATMTFSYTSPTPILSFQWHKTPDNSNGTPLDDTDISAPGGTQQTLTIPDAQWSHEGYYYCTLTNAAGPVNTPVRQLGIKRMTGKWTLDSADYQTDGVTGYYNDTADNAPNQLDGTVINVKQHVLTPGVFVANSDYPSLNQAADFGTNVTAPGYSTNNMWLTSYTDKLTISVWIKWNGDLTGNNQQGIIANQTAATLDETTGGNAWYLELKDQTHGIPWLNCYESAYDSTGTRAITAGEWTHLVITVGADGTKFYYDGVLRSTTSVTRTNPDAKCRTPRRVYLGCSNRDANGLRYPFNGLIDDVRVYNYALDQYQVIDLYSAVSGEQFCVNPDNDDLTLDVAGGGTLGDEPDCKVNMSDLVGFFADWLNCGLYPASGCE